MKTVLAVAGLVALATTGAWAAANIEQSKSNVNRIQLRGTLVTASTDVEPGVARIVYTTPGRGDFLLTQVCVGGVGVLLQAGGVSVVQVGAGTCQSFNPGLLLSAEQALTCAALGGEVDTLCTIAGVLGPPAAPSPTPTGP